MKKKNDAENVTDAKAKPGKAKKEKTAVAGASGISKFMVGGLIVITVVMVAGLGVLGWLQFARQQALSEGRLADVIANQQATLIDEHIGYARKLTEHIAASGVAGAGNASGITEMLPSAEVLIIPASQLLLPDTLSFSARALIQQARKEEKPVVAVLPSSVPLLHVAALMPNNNVVLLSWKMERIKGLIEGQNNSAAHIEITVDKAKLLEVGSITEGQSASVSADAGVSVTVTIPPGANDPALLILFVAVGGGMMALILLTLVSTLLSINRGLRKDSALLVHLSQDLASNPSAKPRENFTFAVLELVVSSLRKLSARAPSSRGVAARSNSGELDSLLAEDDDNLLVVDEANKNNEPGVELPPEIFRAYDIRGVVGKNLTTETVELIGRAIGTEALQAGQQTVIVARDGRLSGESLSKAFIKGLTSSGRDVIDIGMAPTPVLYYAAKVLDSQTGICITGSHNPPNENGLKIVINGETLHGDRITALRDRIARNEFSTGSGKVQSMDISQRYLQEIVNDIVLARPMKVAIDTGNGVTGKLAPELLRQLGCDVVELFTEIDGNFPNHSPDTSKPDNYKALIDAVQQQKAEIGIALDGDGDRIGVVTPSGEIIWADRLMMMFARDLLTRSPGADVIFDVKCSRELSKLISQQGGRPLMWKTGHSFVKAKLKETGAPLAGEMSGHIFFADRWYGFDDGMYAMVRLLEILSLESGDASSVFAELKTGPCTPELSIPVTDQAKFSIIEKLKESAAEFTGGTPVTIDGLRVDFDDGWGLVRASNTGPTLVARFEGASDAALERIKEDFKRQLLAVNPQLRLPF